MSQIGKTKVPYRAPKLTAHGTIRNMTNTSNINNATPNDANGPGSYTS